MAGCVNTLPDLMGGAMEGCTLELCLIPKGYCDRPISLQGPGIVAGTAGATGSYVTTA